MEKLLTIDEISKILQVSKATVYRWVHYDFVPHIKIGGAVRFNEKAVQKWLRMREKPGRSCLDIDTLSWE